MIYYRPTLENAYADMLDLRYTVFLGGFLRNVHRWAGHGIVITVVLHMLRVFYTGSYKPPREFNWIVGVEFSWWFIGARVNHHENSTGLSALVCF